MPETHAQICQFSPLGPSRAARAEPHGLPGSATTHEPATAVKQHRGARRPKRRVYREVIPNDVTDTAHTR